MSSGESFTPVPLSAEPCGAVPAQLSAFVDGELPADVAARVSGHLSRCADCRAALEREAATVRDAVEELVTVTPQPVDRLRLRRALAAETHAEGVDTLVRRRLPWAHAAAAVLLGAIVLLTWSSTDPAPVSGPLASNSESAPPETAPIAKPIDPLENAVPVSIVKIIRGDGDGDGETTLADWELFCRYLDDGLADPNEADLCERAFDFDDDGEITPADQMLFASSLIEKGRRGEVVAYDPTSSQLSCAVTICPL
ncbi:MAG: zf-HC2 domain-containing protein [Planctomycetota bacterium]